MYIAACTRNMYKTKKPPLREGPSYRIKSLPTDPKMFGPVNGSTQFVFFALSEFFLRYMLHGISGNVLKHEVIARCAWPHHFICSCLL